MINVLTNRSENSVFEDQGARPVIKRAKISSK